MSQDTSPSEHDEGHASSSAEGAGADGTSRRDVLKAVGKYSAFLAGTSAVILSADDALAQRACSQIGPPGGFKPGTGPKRCR